MPLFSRAKRAEQCPTHGGRPADICSLRGFRILTDAVEKVGVFGWNARLALKGRLDQATVALEATWWGPTLRQTLRAVGWEAAPGHVAPGS